MQSVDYLVLNSNQFSGQISSLIGNMKKLQYCKCTNSFLVCEWDLFFLSFLSLTYQSSLTYFDSFVLNISNTLYLL
jgi:hypothetical protein